MIFLESYYDIEKRAILFADHIIHHNSTVREVEKHYVISKSTVHKDVTTRLYYLDRSRYDQVRQILNKNKAERHIRGGLATKRKYELQTE